MLRFTKMRPLEVGHGDPRFSGPHRIETTSCAWRGIRSF
jgi:hypothetical protein